MLFADRPADGRRLERQLLVEGGEGMAGTTILELATSAVTGQRSNQLNYVPAFTRLEQGSGGQ